MTRTLTEIDDILRADKSLHGNLEWVEDGARALITRSVVDQRGVVIGGLILQLWALTEVAIQRAGGSLVLDGTPIQRMTYRPGNAHLNNNAHPTPPALRLKTLPAERSRIYLWSNNRAWPIHQNLRAGKVIEPEPASASAAFELFLESCAISTYLPNPPHRPMLEL